MDELQLQLVCTVTRRISIKQSKKYDMVVPQSSHIKVCTLPINQSMLTNIDSPHQASCEKEYWR